MVLQADRVAEVREVGANPRTRVKGAGGGQGVGRAHRLEQAGAAGQLLGEAAAEHVSGPLASCVAVGIPGTRTGAAPGSKQRAPSAPRVTTTRPV